MPKLLSDALHDDLDFKGEKTEFHLTSPEDVDLNDDGITWTKIPNMVLNPLSNGFTATGGTLTKKGKPGKFIIHGVSDLAVSLSCTLYYGLALNGSIVSHEITEHTFTNQAKTENISITALGELSVNDTIEIQVKGDGTNNVTVTVEKLDMTFIG